MVLDVVEISIEGGRASLEVAFLYLFPTFLISLKPEPSASAAAPTLPAYFIRTACPSAIPGIPAAPIGLMGHLCLDCFLHLKWCFRLDC